MKERDDKENSKTFGSSNWKAKLPLTKKGETIWRRLLLNFECLPCIGYSLSCIALILRTRGMRKLAYSLSYIVQ
jgi:hypothetical protein